MDYLKRLRTKVAIKIRYKKRLRKHLIPAKIILQQPPVIIYRLSDTGYNKTKPSYINNENCLKNAVSRFPPDTHDWILIADNICEETMAMIQKYISVSQIHKVSVGNGAGTFRLGYQKALTYEDDRLIYFLENDYLHRENACKILKEGIELAEAEYLTLYDHPDQYGYNSNNPFVEGGEKTQVFLSPNTHWKITNSTTMTFAALVKTLREDWDVFDLWTKKKHPFDFRIFFDLRRKGRRLICPIPTYSTHGESAYLAPLIDWEKEIID